MNNERSSTKDVWKDVKYILSTTFYGFFFVHSIIMGLTWIVPPQSEIYEHLEGMSYFHPQYRLLLILLYLVAAALLHLYLSRKRRTLEQIPVIREQMEQMERGETVHNPHPMLNQCWSRFLEFQTSMLKVSGGSENYKIKDLDNDFFERCLKR